jgi:hypothetical protein
LRIAEVKWRRHIGNKVRSALPDRKNRTGKCRRYDIWECRVQRAEGRGQRAEGRGQRAEGRGQRAEKKEGRGQKKNRPLKKSAKNDY